jgi:putative oxidoreductase
MAYSSTTARWFSPSPAVPTTMTIPWAPLAGRILLCTIFLLSGVTKFIDWQGTAAYMASKNMPLIPVLLPLAGALEIVCGLALLLGTKSRLAALALFFFLIPTTFIFHNFWAQAGMEYTNQMHHFLKNLAIMGGLALIVGLGPGHPSIDGWRRPAATR